MIGFIRTLYLLLLASAFPLAFLHYDYFHPDRFEQMGDGTKSALIFGSFFLIMFHLLFAARYFPFDLKSGIGYLTGILITVFTSSLLNSSSPFLGAFALVFTTSLTYAVYFFILCLIFLQKKKREKYFYYDEKPYLILLLFFLVISGSVTALLTNEYYRALLTEELWILIVIALTGMGYEVFQSVKRLLAQNMFQFDKGPEKVLRDNQLKKSGWLTVSLMFAAITFITLILYSVLH